MTFKERTWLVRVKNLIFFRWKKKKLTIKLFSIQKFKEPYKEKSSKILSKWSCIKYMKYTRAAVKWKERIFSKRRRWRRSHASSPAPCLWTIKWRFSWARAASFYCDTSRMARHVGWKKGPRLINRKNLSIVWLVTDFYTG